MLQKQKEPIEEGEVPLTEQLICEQVLGKAYGYIRGRGHGPKPNRRAYSSASSSTQHVVEELASRKEIVATQQAQIEAQQSQLEAQQKKIDWLQSVVSNLVGISPPMDGTSATGLGFTTERPMPSDGIGMQHINLNYFCHFLFTENTCSILLLIKHSNFCHRFANV